MRFEPATFGFMFVDTDGFILPSTVVARHSRPSRVKLHNVQTGESSWKDIPADAFYEAVEELRFLCRQGLLLVLAWVL